ncbi:MAG TPA: ABC transporter substrate-binding protein, partial [Sporichthyaceae bacterium]|nr:ABC transporter substrate-binding protein [Sporichthyaceae bacterium]
MSRPNPPTTLRTPPVLAWALAVVLLLAACGTRVSKSEVRAGAGAGTVTLSAESIDQLKAAVAPLARPAPGGAVETNAGAGTAIKYAANATVRSVSSSSGGAAADSARSGPVTPMSSPATLGARTTAKASSLACTGPGEPLRIGQIGNFSGIAGPVTAGARAALAVWVASVNARGGLDCHPLVLYTVDDEQDSSRAAAAVQSLTEEKKVQALVGVFSIISFNGLVSGVNRAKVPVIGGDLAGFPWNEEPFLFPQGAGLRDVVHGGLQQAVATGLTKVALLYCVEASVCTTDAKVIPEEMTKAGGSIVYSSPVSLTQTDFTAQCQNARNAGAQALRIAADGATMGRVARSCAALNYHPKLIGVNVAVGPAQAADESLRQNTLLVSSANAPWTRTDTPGQSAFLAALTQYAPNLTPNAGAMAAWA